MSCNVVCYVGAKVLSDEGVYERRCLWTKGRYIIDPQTVHYIADNYVFLNATHIIVPAFIDIKLNGAYGIDFSDPGLEVDDYKLLRKKLYQHGIVAFLPTVNAASEAAYRLLLKKLVEGNKKKRLRKTRRYDSLFSTECSNVGKKISQNCLVSSRKKMHSFDSASLSSDDNDDEKMVAGAIPLGVHADGPFLNPYQADGAHCEDHLKSFAGGKFQRTKSGRNYKDFKTTTKLKPTLIKTNTMAEDPGYKDVVIEDVDDEDKVLIDDDTFQANKQIDKFLDEDHCNNSNNNQNIASLVLRRTYGKNYDKYIKLISCAPELPYGMESLKEMKKRGIIAAISHSRATHEEGLTAIENGVTLITHVFNGIPSYGHREPGLMGLLAQLKLPQNLYFGLIADGVHCSTEALILAARLAKKQIILISDACAPTGQPGTAWMLRNTVVKKRNSRLLRCNSQCDLEIDESEIYGSVTMLDECIKIFYEAVKNYVQTPEEISFLSGSQNPAKLLGLYPKYGSLNPGSYANFLVWDNNEIIMTFHNGRMVFRKNNE